MINQNNPPVDPMNPLAKLNVPIHPTTTNTEANSEVLTDLASALFEEGGIPAYTNETQCPPCDTEITGNEGNKNPQY